MPVSSVVQFSWIDCPVSPALFLGQTVVDPDASTEVKIELCLRQFDQQF